MRAFATLLVLLAAAASGQAPGDCTPGRANGTISVGGVEAGLQNNGMLFYGSGGAEQYEVPRGEGVAALYAASLWVGGTVGGELRVAGTTFGQGGRNNDFFEFWPGPLDQGTAALPNPTDCSPYDRIWVVSARDVTAYEGGATPSADLAEWPVGLGAPAVDAGGAPVTPDRRDQRIDLAAGERPDLLGQQSAFWVMNDVGNEHPSLESPPLGVEVRVLAGGFLDPRSPTLTTATAYRYEIVNRSAQTVEDLRASLFIDWQLGNSADDKVGSDSTRSMAYVYNSDNEDDGGYGSGPPALGIDMLTGAYSAMYFVGGDSNRGGPRDYIEADRLMRGVWTDGTPLTMSGGGYATAGRPIRWAFPGKAESGDFWSETDALSAPGRQPTVPGRREGLLSSRPVTLAPGEVETVDIAILYARGSDNFRSITRLREASTTFQGLYNAGRIFPSQVRPVAGEPAPAAGALDLAVAPNPAASRAAVSFALAAPADVRVTVVDVLGRTVRVVADGPRAAGTQSAEVDLSGLAAGRYLVVVEAGAGRAARPLSVVR